MPLEFVLPFGKKGDVKNLVFSILTKEYPLKLIELTTFIRRRYGKEVSFQAVRKAVLQLVGEGVLIREENVYAVNKEWVREIKGTIDALYSQLNQEKSKAQQADSISGDVSIFSFDSLNAMMAFWQDIISDWFRTFRKGDYALNCYQAAHAWEGLLHLEREKTIMGQLKKKGIKSYIISTGSAPLDRNIQKFYKKIGVHMRINPSFSHFDRGHYLATYGNLIVQTQYPDETVKALEKFFKKNKTIEELDLEELSEIVNRKIAVKLTVIKNLEMAKQLNRSMIASTR